ncbi:MAG: hypothetical protein KatS3mg059_0571 [Thermomicrobiales bacterium]|nr:MAG: hypothetical protein KatS3mg059_0571 [Thermomicrobiales bacterium]
MKRLAGAILTAIVILAIVAPLAGLSRDLDSGTPTADASVAEESDPSPTATESPPEETPAQEVGGTETSTAEATATEAPPAQESPTPSAEASLTETAAPSPTETSSPQPTATAPQTLVTLEFRPEADAWVTEDEPDDNFGDSPDLIVDGVGDPVIESYLRFRVQGIRGSVERALLRVRTRSTTWAGSVNGPAVFTAGNSWTERGITWENRPPVTSGMIDNVGAVEIGTWVTYDVTVAISADGTYTFLLAADSSDGVKFSSREGSSPPRLLVTLDLQGTQTPRATPTVEPPTPLPTDTPQPVPTDTPEPTATPVPTDTPEPTATATATETPEPTATATPTDTPASTAEPTTTPTSTPAQIALSVLPEADAFVAENNPGANFGNKTTLVVDGDNGAHVESYARFVVTGVQGTVESATLRFHTTTSSWAVSSDGPDVAAASNDWTEGGVAWSKRPPLTSASVHDLGPVSANTWIEFDVTSLVPGDGTYTFALLPTSNDGIEMWSRTGTIPPQLVIRYRSTGAPTSTPTAEPVSTETPAPTSTPVATETPSPTLTTEPTSTPEPSSTPAATNTPQPTATRTAEPTSTATPASTPTPMPTSTPTPTATSTRTPVPTATATPGNGSAVTVAAAGDVACTSSGTTSCAQRLTGDLIRRLNPNAVFMLGDMQYEFATLDNIAAGYDPAWGSFKSITYPVAGGSHDFYGGGDFATYWGAQAGVPNKNWYSFDLGAWHVVVIASYCSRNGNCEEQKAWLSADLAAHPNQCTLAMWHQPRYSSGAVHGSYTGIDWAWDMLYSAGAELVLTGHDHTYERFAPTGANDERDNAFGLREFVVGTGGRSHYDFNSPLSTTEVRDNTTYGVLLLTLKPGGYDWKFVPVNSGGFTDAGSGSCHGKPSSAGATSSTLGAIGPVAGEGWVFALVLAVRRRRSRRRGVAR